jgi:hypothetical protein
MRIFFSPPRCFFSSFFYGGGWEAERGKMSAKMSHGGGLNKFTKF